MHLFSPPYVHSFVFNETLEQFQILFSVISYAQICIKDNETKEVSQKFTNHNSILQKAHETLHFYFIVLFTACLWDNNHQILNQTPVMNFEKRVYVKTDKNKLKTTALCLLCIGYSRIAKNFSSPCGFVVCVSGVFISEMNVETSNKIPMSTNLLLRT
jgi:hypothetical protein